MKKLYLLIFTLFLFSCSSNTPTEPSFYSDYEKQEIDYLIHNGQYFDTELISAKSPTYSLDESGLLVDFNNDDFTIFFGLMGDLYYEYYFDDVSFTYTIDGIEKTATLSSFFITDYGEFKINNREFPYRLNATLTISDGQVFNIYFIFIDWNDPWIGNHDHPKKNEIFFTDELHQQILNTWKQQWNQISLFHHDQIQFSNLFQDILLGPAFYKFKPKQKFNLPHHYRVDWALYPYGKVEEIYPEYVSYPDVFSNLMHDDIKIEDEKLNNTLDFILNLNESIDQNHLPDNELLIQSLIDVQPEYGCESHGYCYSKLDKEPRMFYQAVGWGSIILTENFFNTQMSVLFDTKFNYQISETKLLDSGIVQSKEEKTFVAYSWMGDGVFISTEAELVKEYKFEDGVAEIELIFYKTTYDYENERLLLLTSSGEIPLPKENKIDFILENSSDFSHWTLTLQENDSDLFYTILSATKIKEVRP